MRLLNRRNLNVFLISLLLLLLPTQFGKHFFFDFSFVNGVRVDYLAPTLYVTDIIVFLLVIANIPVVIKALQNKFFIFLLCIAIVNIFFALSKEVAIYRWVRVLEAYCLFILMFSFFRHRDPPLAGSGSQTTKKRDPDIHQADIVTTKTFGFSLLSGTIIQFVLAVLQFINHHSMQGFFYYLGERSFNLSTPGIAKATLNGVEFLRPYGTFSHPNSMGGFYLLIYFFVLTSEFFRHPGKIRRNFSQDQKHFGFWIRIDFVNLTRMTLLLICSCLVFLSFSKIAILTFLILNVVYLFQTKFYKHCIICFISRIAGLIVLTAIVLVTTTDIFTVDKRWELIQNAVQIIQQHPIFGVGLGNYVIAQQNFSTTYLNFINQPVHNIFLLLGTELGLPMSLIFFYMLIRHIRPKLANQTFLFFIFIVGFTGFFDHYWLTLQQNFLLIPILLAFCFKEEKKFSK